MALIIPTPAADVQPGCYVDLEGDPYASEAGDPDLLQYEYIMVEHVERETPDCVRFDLTGFDSVGFPVSHVIKVVDPDDEMYDELAEDD